MIFPIGSQTTDWRFVKVDANAWWDTTGIGIASDDEVEEYMVANGIGVMVFEDDRPTLH